jgi:adenylate cyclase
MLERRAPLVVTNAQTDKRLAPVHDLMRERGTASLLVVPLTARGEVIGSIGLDALERREFDAREIDLAQNVAAAAGQALETAQLYQALQRHAAELARALERQQELDRLKSEFIQNVSHELRTPLALALGYAELLHSGELGELQPDQREPVAVVARRLQMLSRLLDDINAILEVETQTLQRRSVDLADLIHTILADSQIWAVAEKHRLTLEEDIPADCVPLLGDPGLLWRMLDNLLNNALKFTPAGGRIVVHLRYERTEAVLRVTDTGIGIPADQLERVFERFYQVDGSTTRRYGGTGLGLALVKKIAEKHEGRVTVESQVGQGSTFTVWLPLGNEHQQDVK